MNLQMLKLKLSDFGLNPKDWKIQIRPEAHGLVEIRGRRGQAFRFFGRVERNQWLELKLVV